MNMAQQILDRINNHPNNPLSGGLDFSERELVLAELKVNSHKVREVSKEVKNQRYKETSRHDEEEMGFTNQTEENYKTAVVSASVTKEVPALELSSRTYTGISVQHCRTKTGVRLAITLQTASAALEGAVTLLTAELKRYDRLREIRARDDVDSDWFHDHLDDTVIMIRESRDKSVCLGRIHARGKRAAWYQDCFVVGFMLDERIGKVILNLEGEVYVIDMELGLSERQLINYVTGGIYGHLKQARSSAPRLANAPTVPFGG